MTVILIMMAVCIVCAAIIGFAFGCWYANNQYRCHHVRISKPWYTPEDEINKKLREQIEVSIIKEGMIEQWSDDYGRHAAVTFYQKDKKYGKEINQL